MLEVSQERCLEFVANHSHLLVSVVCCVTFVMELPLIKTVELHEGLVGKGNRMRLRRKRRIRHIKHCRGRKSNALYQILEPGLFGVELVISVWVVPLQAPSEDKVTIIPEMPHLQLALG